MFQFQSWSHTWLKTGTRRRKKIELHTSFTKEVNEELPNVLLLLNPQPFVVPQKNNNIIKLWNLDIAWNFWVNRTGKCFMFLAKAVCVLTRHHKTRVKKMNRNKNIHTEWKDFVWYKIHLVQDRVRSYIHFYVNKFAILLRSLLKHARSMFLFLFFEIITYL